jgi:hypothetical protein
LFQLRELGKDIEQEPTRLASLVTPKDPSRLQTPNLPILPHTSIIGYSEMVTPVGLGVVTPVTITQEQLNQILQQLYWPPTMSNPKVDDPELYYGERAKLWAFLTQYQLTFNYKMNKFDIE